MPASMLTFYLSLLRRYSGAESIFQTKNLNTEACRLKNETCLRNSILFVEVSNETQTSRLLKTAYLGPYPIKVEKYMSFNSWHRVVRTDFVDRV